MDEMKEIKSSTLSVDVNDEKSLKIADNQMEVRRKETLKILAEADSFVLIAINGEDGCAISGVSSKHSVSIVKMLGKITKQLLDQTMKSRNIPVIMDMMAMMHEERGKESKQK